MLSGSSTVEEHSPCHPKVAGLSPVTTAGNERERNGFEKNLFNQNFFFLFKWYVNFTNLLINLILPTTILGVNLVNLFSLYVAAAILAC
jgi:hypothetical protein